MRHLVLVGALVGCVVFVSLGAGAFVGGVTQSERPASAGAVGAGTMKRFFAAYGKVQGVMFRQTLMRAAQKRDLFAAATNCRTPAKDKVVFELEGEEEKMEEIVSFMRSGQVLNSWNAKVTRLEEVEAAAAAQDLDRNPYQVTTDNVDNFKWTPGLEGFVHEKRTSTAR